MTDSTDRKLYHDELEASAQAIVGKIIFTYSCFETNLGLCLRYVVGGRDVEAVNPLVQRLNLKNRLDSLLEVVEHKFGSDSECYSELKLWHRKVDRLRATRNSFVHGRWAALTQTQQVVNVSPSLPGASSKEETRYSLQELRRELEKLELALNEFFQLRKRWHL